MVYVLVASKNLMVGEVLKEDSVKLEKKLKNIVVPNNRDHNQLPSPDESMLGILEMIRKESTFV